MRKEGAPKLLCVGPLGIGHQVLVEGQATNDSGIRCKQCTRIAVWDCAIVAWLAADTFSVELAGNPVGPVESEWALIRAYRVQRGITLSFIGEPPACPCYDFIVVDCLTSSRTWYSTVAPPSIADVSRFLSRQPSDRIDALYVDHWAVEQNEVFLAECERLCGAGFIWYNFGDTEDLQERIWLSRVSGTQPIVFQISAKAQAGDFAFAKRWLERLELGERVAVLITRGPEDILFRCGPGPVETVSVRAVRVASATGAGAHLAAGLMSALAAEPNLETIRKKLAAIAGSVSDALESESLELPTF